MRGIHEGPQMDPEDPPTLSGAQPKVRPLLTALAVLLLTTLARAQAVPNGVQDGPDGVDPVGVHAHGPKEMIHFQIQPQPAVTSSVYGVIGVSADLEPKWGVVLGANDMIESGCTRRQGDYCWGVCTAMCPVDKKLDDAECVSDGHGGSSCICYGHRVQPQYASSHRQ